MICLMGEEKREERRGGWGATLVLFTTRRPNKARFSSAVISALSHSKDKEERKADDLGITGP